PRSTLFPYTTLFRSSRCDRVFALAREYGAAVICLTIDEEGQARTADWKVRVAKRIHDLAVNDYGLEPGDLIFDALTFPLGAGQRSEEHTSELQSREN